MLLCRARYRLTYNFHPSSPCLPPPGRRTSRGTAPLSSFKTRGGARDAPHTRVPKSIPIHESRIRSMPGDFQVVDGEKGLFHKEIPFGNWRAASYVNFFDVVPYVPEGFNDKRIIRSEITGEAYHIGTTDYAVTRIAECGGLDPYLLATSEEEIDSQFGVELKRTILQILECERLIGEPVSTEDCLRHSLKLEAILGFKLSTTDAMISTVLHDQGIDEDDNLIGNVFEDDFL